MAGFKDTLQPLCVALISKSLQFFAEAKLHIFVNWTSVNFSVKQRPSWTD